MRQRCNCCFHHVSQHFAKRPPAVRCGSRWKWSLAGDLNWLNESLNDSWPQEERSLQIHTHISRGVRSGWEEPVKRRRRKKTEMGGGGRSRRRCLRLCNSKKQVSCWSALALHTWSSLMLWCRTHTHTEALTSKLTPQLYSLVCVCR